VFWTPQTTLPTPPYRQVRNPVPGSAHSATHTPTPHNIPDGGTDSVSKERQTQEEQDKEKKFNIKEFKCIYIYSSKKNYLSLTFIFNFY
jgi:hypothetical protein